MCDLSTYAVGLQSTCMQMFNRYLEKISVLNFDPFYQFRFHISCDNSSYRNYDGSVLKLDEKSITEYFINGISFFTGQQFKSYKSLEARNYLVSGKIETVKFKSVATVNGVELFVVLANVGHSLKTTEPPVSLWLLLRNDGDGEIVTGHCTCVAGCAESCSHLAAVCYLIASPTVEKPTVTEVVAYWKQPSASSAPKSAVEISDACFNTIKKMMKKPNSKGVRNFKRKIRVPVVEISTFLNDVKNNSTSALYRVIQPWSGEMHINNQIFKPGELRLLFNPEYENLELEELIELGQAHKDSVLSISEEEIVLIEKQTKNQNKCKKWYSYRCGRITATSSREVCRIRSFTSNISLLRKICYPNRKGKTSNSMKWGLIHEADAVEAYRKYHQRSHVLGKIEKCGLFINKQYPFIGGSPDRLVWCLCCEGQGILETKCPYTLMKEGYSLKNLPYLNEKDDLLKTSAYYYQVQTQLFSSNSVYCDFVIWSPDVFTIQRLYKDETIFNEVIFHASQYFDNVVLPELLGRYYTREAEKCKAVHENNTNEVEAVSNKNDCAEKLLIPSQSNNVPTKKCRGEARKPLASKTDNVPTEKRSVGARKPLASKTDNVPTEKCSVGARKPLASKTDNVSPVPNQKLKNSVKKQPITKSKNKRIKLDDKENL